VHLPGIRTGEVLADSTTLAAACSMLVGRMLADWSRTPEIERLPVSEFLRRHLADRVQSGKALAELARRWPGRTIRLQGEAVDLPNPFALVFDPSPHIDIDVTAIVGKGHGDLHTENVIVSRGGKDFWLIDLARYRPDAPLTQDPVQLELAIVNRILGGLRLEDREILLRVLSGPTLSGLDTLPEWLAALIGGIRDTCHSWIARSHLGEEWQAATALSAVACALIFAARPTTSLDNRVWFLRLAARSAAVFADASVPDGFVADPRPSAIGPSVLADDGGLAKLCSAYRDLVGQLISDRSARVDSLAARARHGVDIREELGRLAREWRVRLDGSRGAGLAGLAGQATVADIFGCPLGTSPCTRSEARQPGGPLPFCHVANEPMTRLTGAT
jgi:hypothetical protein